MALENKIFFENCSLTLDRLPDKLVGLLLQDPPYGVTQNEWDKAPDLSLLWGKWNRVCKDNAAMLFFATMPFAVDLINSNRKAYRYDLVWYKPLGTGFLNANEQPLRNHELILMFYRKQPTYNPQMTIGKMKQKGGGVGGDCYGYYKGVKKKNNIYYPQSVFTFSNGNRRQEQDHPTQKPLNLIRYLIRTYSNEDDIVFDGYMGSGTTAHAAVLENRRFIGSESQQSYFDIVTKRLDKVYESLNTTPNLFQNKSKLFKIQSNV